MSWFERRNGRALEPIDVEIAPGGKVMQVEIPLVGKGADDTSNAALATLREELIPATLGKVSGIEYAVTGDTAASTDWNEAMKSAVPIAFVFVLAFALLLLLVSFRSVVIPLKLLGRWNSYLPRWLEWLPRLEHARSTDPAPQQAAA